MARKTQYEKLFLYRDLTREAVLKLNRLRVLYENLARFPVKFEKMSRPAPPRDAFQKRRNIVAPSPPPSGRSRSASERSSTQSKVDTPTESVLSPERPVEPMRVEIPPVRSTVPPEPVIRGIPGKEDVPALAETLPPAVRLESPGKRVGKRRSLTQMGREIGARFDRYLTRVAVDMNEIENRYRARIKEHVLMEEAAQRYKEEDELLQERLRRALAIGEERSLSDLHDKIMEEFEKLRKGSMEPATFLSYAQELNRFRRRQQRLSSELIQRLGESQSRRSSVPEIARPRYSAGTNLLSIDAGNNNAYMSEFTQRYRTAYNIPSGVDVTYEDVLRLRSDLHNGIATAWDVIEGTLEAVPRYFEDGPLRRFIQSNFHEIRRGMQMRVDEGVSSVMIEILDAMQFTGRLGWQNVGLTGAYTQETVAAFYRVLSGVISSTVGSLVEFGRENAEDIVRQATRSMVPGLARFWDFIGTILFPPNTLTSIGGIGFTADDDSEDFTKKDKNL